MDPRDNPPPRARQASMWRRYLRFWGTRVEDDFDDELRFHLEMRIRDYRAQGLDEPGARAAALAKIGDVASTRAECLTIANRTERTARRAQTMDALMRDLTFAFRTLGRQKIWTTVAIVTLALGIGANTAVFSVVNAVLLNPLRYRDADRVVMLWRAQATTGVMMAPSPQMIDAWRAGSHSLEAIENYRPQDATLLGRGEAAVVHTAAIGSGFLDFAGGRLLIGRGFSSGETKVGALPVAILGEGLWRERYGGTADVLGQRIEVDGKAYTIIGVAPAALRLPSSAQLSTDVWLPLIPDPKAFTAAAIGRLRPGVTLERAQAELDSLRARNVPLHPGAPALVTRLTRPRDVVPFRESLYLLWGAVALLLVIACANVAHLLLARGASRERELAIRTALGASKGRLVRQLLTESSILAAAGCAAGLGVGYAMLQAFIALRPPRLGSIALAHLDPMVLMVTVAAAVFTGLAFGLIGAVHAMRRVAYDSLKSATTTGTRHRHRVRSTLVVTEMALSAMLLIAAVLLVRSVINLQRTDPGFRTANLYSLDLDPPSQRYTTPAARDAFANEVLAQAKRVPGVIAATIALSAPPMSGYVFATIDVENGAPPDGPAAGANAMNSVPPEYFQLLDIPLVAGRAFDAGSMKRQEVIVNQGMAKRLWPGKSAIGQHFRFAAPGDKKVPWMTVVGVAQNVVTRGLSNERGEPLIYLPWESMQEVGSAVLLVRTREGFNPAPALRRMVVSLDPRQAPPPVASIEHALSESIASQRFTMTLLTIFAALAVLLSAVGLYGVIAYMVAQRTREIGIRIALGATPKLIARAVLVRGVVLALVGLLIGLVGAAWGSRAIATMLYGVRPVDPVSYLAGGLLLLVIAIAACAVPMRRAMRVDPMIAMRAE